MSSTVDYYATLGVPRSAKAAEIRQAYRSLARKYHPDVNSSEDAATRFAEVQAAYDVLSDAQKRRTYDTYGSAGERLSSGPRWSHEAGGADFTEVFESMFGGGSPFGRPPASPSRAPSPRRGGDITLSIAVTFMTSVRGGSEEISVDGSSPISLRIPAGIEPGSKLRLRGKGDPGSMGGEAGDVLVTVDVGAHPWYRRNGLDIELDVPVNAAEAALGTSVTLPLPLGGTVDMAIPAGVSSGQRLRVRGKGVATDERVGDFHAVIQIVGSAELDDASLECFKSLRDRLPNPREDAPWADRCDG